MDAIDTKVGEIAPFDGDSKILLCVINKLKNDDKFKLISKYIFPLNKITSLVAIYSDMALLPSIGELTVADDSSYSGLFNGARVNPTFEQKPGAKVTFPNSENDDFTPDYSDSNDYWVSYADRTSTVDPFVTKWDEWDRVLLRNSKSRIKKLFKEDYYGRDFTAADAESSDVSGVIVDNLKSAIKLPAGVSGLLPNWRLKNLISNPFNSKGQLCKKED